MANGQQRPTTFIDDVLHTICYSLQTVLTPIQRAGSRFGIAFVLVEPVRSLRAPGICPDFGDQGDGVSAAGPTHRTSYVTSRLMAFEVTAQDTQMDMIRYMMRLAVSFIIEGAFLPREAGPSSRVVWGAPTLNLVRAKLPFCLGPSSAANLEPVEICL